jgi:hypothetical protein
MRSCGTLLTIAIAPHSLIVRLLNEAFRMTLSLALLCKQILG